MSISLRKTEPEKRNRKEKKIAKRFAILYPFSRIGRRSNEPFSVLLPPASYHGPRGMEPLQCTTGVNLASYYVRSLSHESLRRLYMAGENAEWKTFWMVLLRCRLPSPCTSYSFLRSFDAKCHQWHDINPLLCGLQHVKFVSFSGSWMENGGQRADILFLKHACSILRQSSNPVCGFSMMEQVRLCAVWPTENWLGSSRNHIQFCMTVWETCRHALEKGCLTARERGKGGKGALFSRKLSALFPRVTPTLPPEWNATSLIRRISNLSKTKAEKSEIALSPFSTAWLKICSRKDGSKESQCLGLRTWCLRCDNHVLSFDTERPETNCGNREISRNLSTQIPPLSMNNEILKPLTATVHM